MKIGVTGAFGFLGARFVAALLERNRHVPVQKRFEVTAFSSRTRSNPLFDPRQVTAVSLDILDAANVTAAFAGLECVAHFAGRVEFESSRKREVWDANVIGTLRVFDAALAAGVGRLLHVSSVNALGGSAGPALLDEHATPYENPGRAQSFRSAAEALAAVRQSCAGDYSFLRRVHGAYLDSKLAGWELAKFYARERGLDVVTVFPGTAVGAGDLHHGISDLVDRAWEGRLRIAFSGATSFVDAGDFAEGAVLAVERGRAGDGYILSGRDDENLTYPEFIELISSVAAAGTGRPGRRCLALPRPLALGVASVIEWLAPGGQLSRALAESGSVRNVCTSAKARAELGYANRTPLSASVLECRRFSLEHRARNGRPAA